MLNAQRTALSLTATVAILYIICSIAYATIPGPSMALSQAVFHGMLGAVTVTFGSFLIGLITLCLPVYAGGLIFAGLYNAGATRNPGA